MVGAYSNNLITAFQVGDAQDPFDERYIEIRAQSVVVATGCIERPLLFDHNERPGVMQAGCAQRLARTYGILPGKAAVFSVGHDLGLEAALDLGDLGVRIHCVADCRPDGQDRDLLQDLAERRIPVLTGWVAARVHGGRHVKAVTLATIEGTAKRRLACDLLVASAGLTPVNGPLILAQAKLALEMFAYRVKKYIGAYTAALGGVDIIVFTGGIGERDAETRKRIRDGLEYLGIEIDETHLNVKGEEVMLTTPASKVKVLVVPTDEEMMIARDTYDIVESTPAKTSHV